MQNLNEVRDYLKGKKTYLVALATILGLVVAWSTNEVDTVTAVQGIVTAILASTIRDGINTAVKQ